MPGDLHAAGRQQPEHVAPHGFRARRRPVDCPAHLRAHDQVIVAPFTKTLGAITGPTQDRDTVVGAIDAIESERRHGDSRLRWWTRRDQLGGAREPPDHRADHRRLRREQRRRFDRRARRREGRQATIYVIGIGGVAGISLKGEDLLKRLANETGGRAFFPAREFQLAGVHDLIRRRRAAAVSADVHADQSGAGRHVARDHGEDLDAHCGRARARRVSGACAAAGAAADRTDGPRSEPATR